MYILNSVLYIGRCQNYMNVEVTVMIFGGVAHYNMWFCFVMQQKVRLDDCLSSILQTHKFLFLTFSDINP